jgi:hypothetical protein
MSGQNFRQGDLQFFRGNLPTEKCIVNKGTTNASLLTMTRANCKEKDHRVFYLEFSVLVSLHWERISDSTSFSASETTGIK